MFVFLLWLVLMKGLNNWWQIALTIQFKDRKVWQLLIRCLSCNKYCNWWFKILLFSGLGQRWKRLCGNTDSPQFMIGCLVAIWGYGHLRKETYKVDLKVWWSSPLCSHMTKFKCSAIWMHLRDVCIIPWSYACVLWWFYQKPTLTSGSWQNPHHSKTLVCLIAIAFT